MNSRILQGIGWTAFAALLATVGVVFLSACDFGFMPVFGLRYCQAKAAPLDLASEREREWSLRARIHEAELKVAQLPLCAKDTAPPKPAEPPVPPPQPPPPEPLKIPKQLSELEGCWQSERGDIQIVSDDEARRPTGRVRICFCLGANGRGKARVIYNDDGQTCDGDLGANIEQKRLTMRHNLIPCAHGTSSGINGEIIVCTADAGGTGTCDSQTLGRVHGGLRGEKFERVSNEHCGWHPSR
ncbi:MAG TPA: hypothetical protein VH206_20060 [Xanthobacteraceae bacterium]|nr:hypothetical protein [Xanthobacteraceae bacterium]